MRQYGTPINDVAKLVGISVPVLRRLYKEELDAGEILANMAVGERLFDRCMAGDTAALIFWAKTRMKWSEKEPQKEALAITVQAEPESLLLKLIGIYSSGESEE